MLPVKCCQVSFVENFGLLSIMVTVMVLSGLIRSLSRCSLGRSFWFDSGKWELSMESEVMLLEHFTKYIGHFFISSHDPDVFP